MPTEIQPKRKILCRIVLGALIALYVMALALYAIGTFGLFGSSPGPLAGVFLLPLGLPWTLLDGGMPDPMLPWFGALAPMLNIALIALLCRNLR